MAFSWPGWRAAPCHRSLYPVTRSQHRARWLSRWLIKSAAILAAVAQLMIVCLQVSEGRLGVGLGPHAESASTGGHYVHDEAQCPGCQAQATHALLQSQPSLGDYGPTYTKVLVAAATFFESAARSSTNSRAPPV